MVVTVVVVVVVFNSLRTRIIAACGEPHLLWEFRVQAPARLISIPAQHARPFVHTSESRPFHLPYPRQASYHHANQKTKSPPSEEYALQAFTLTLGSAHRSLHADPPVVLCGPQLASMLGCWAATKDVRSIGACREHAQTLFECMRTAVRPPFFVSQQGTDVLRTPGSQ